MASDWSQTELELIVADYFAMLRAELAGAVVNKADHNRRLRESLSNRSRGSVEFKYANISAALLNLDDLPYVAGYKPRWNYQHRIEDVIREYLAAEPGFFAKVESSPIISPSEPPATDFDDVRSLLEPPPVYRPSSPARLVEPRARKVDFVQRDAENRRLGRLGEAWALEFERRRLHDVAKRPDLARQVVWVSDAEGDGLGYDIRSFNPDASPRFIEVKTTGLGKDFPFAVTANEVRVSERESARYSLYRVFNFSRDARLYTLSGALSQVCHLEARQYSARAMG